MIEVGPYENDLYRLRGPIEAAQYFQTYMGRIIEETVHTKEVTGTMTK